jgi:hypothetical protein
MINVRCAPEVLEYLQTLPPETGQMLVRAMGELADERRMAEAESLAAYGFDLGHRLEVEGYKLLFQYPLPSVQDGGFPVLWIVGVIEPTQGIEEDDFFRRLADSAWHHLRRALPHR